MQVEVQFLYVNNWNKNLKNFKKELTKPLKYRTIMSSSIIIVPYIAYTAMMLKNLAIKIKLIGGIYDENK